MTSNLPLDKRGYAGAERNRVMSPEDVIWARAEYFAQRITTRQLSRQFGLGMDSVRRMLRGDTYGNIEGATPRAQEAKAEVLNIDDGGVFDRLMNTPENDRRKTPKPPPIDPFAPGEVDPVAVFLGEQPPPKDEKLG